MLAVLLDDDRPEYLGGQFVSTVVSSLDYERLTDFFRSGQPIPANDAWIAALAIQHKLPVLSRDQHFDVVPDLKRKTW